MVTETREREELVRQATPKQILLVKERIGMPLAKFILPLKEYFHRQTALSLRKKTYSAASRGNLYINITKEDKGLKDDSSIDWTLPFV